MNKPATAPARAGIPIGLLAYQIEMHAQILERWFSPAEARREVRRRMAAGQSWLWPEPEQLELFA